jgi:glyoxylase-like metal-dependent hydrolase (beta-lactamase superfamily II)
MNVKQLVFNPLQENTYILYDDTGECIIIDPGCQHAGEKDLLKQTITELKLSPKALLNTHCHFDHIFGNNFVCSEYSIEAHAHEGELPNIKRFMASSAMFGYSGEAIKPPTRHLTDRQIFKFGNSTLELIHTPGHSPGSMCFYSKNDKFLISGDTLFAGSIGRTDLPGGDYDLIMKSLEKLITLPDDTKVYCGHASSTTIGMEKMHNPFLVHP